MANFTLTQSTLFKQYQLNGTNASATVTPYDSGTILGTVPPGKAGLKLIDGTIQKATTAKADATAGVNGNFTQDSAYQGQAAGYSLLGE
jgi:hypothetical protein